MIPSNNQESTAIAAIDREQANFPQALLNIPDPPDAMYLQGKIPPAPRVAIVGARRCDSYGQSLAKSLARELTLKGIAIVSGGAAGVDTFALESCLDNGGFPVAVLGTGVDVAYPASNRKLFLKIAQRGALLSEYPPGTPGRPGNFPRRNRIVSGLSDAVVVVRAEKNSGSLITARLAIRQKRPLFAVPGPVGQPLSEGCHQLLRDGANLLESADDVIALLGLDSTPGQMQLNLHEKQARDEHASIPVDLGPQERLLIQALEHGPMPLDVLAQETGLDMGTLSGLVLELQLQNLLMQRSGLIYSSVAHGAKRGKVR